MVDHSARYGEVGFSTGQGELHWLQFLIPCCDSWMLFNIAHPSVANALHLDFVK